MKITDELHVANRISWRRWLRRNHDKKKGIWLVYYKKHTGKPSIPYDDSVEEALCFGWIDSILKKIDDERFVRKFTPRKSRSTWSETNKTRVQKMIVAGKMAKAGLLRIEEAKKSGEWFKKSPIRKELVIPSYVKEALEENRKALDNFNNLAKSYKRQYVGWISSAKKEETRRRRLAEAIRLLEKNEKLGMK
ncbi:MAG: YdeI/OmpD-associated family protein [Candidatus Bathyarchaeota archaeon]|nr:MAG: YdeI/OmpD-associated family protein [Candidatus Bathyarchaeota archaeon]